MQNKGHKKFDPFYLIVLFIFIVLFFIYFFIEIHLRWLITAIIYPAIILIPIFLYIPVVKQIGISIEDKLSFFLAMLWLTLLSRFIAEAIWCWYYDLILRQLYPFPGISDVFTLIAYIFINIGVYTYISSIYREIKPKLPLRYKLTAITLVVVVIIIVAIVLFLPIALAFEEIITEYGTFTVIFVILYNILSITLVSITIFGVIVIGGRLGRLVNLILLAITLIMVFALSFAILEILDMYFEGHPIELLDLAAYLISSLVFYEVYKLTKEIS